MIAKYDHIICIDPDAEKSGVAILDVAQRLFTKVCNMPFPELVMMVRDFCNDNANARLMICVEAGWMVEKSNYHPYFGRRAEKIARDVGRNHETGRKIIEMFRYWNLNVTEQHPLKKCWKGADGKITREELAMVTGFDARTNQDERDAALMAWYVSGLPIRVKC